METAICTLCDYANKNGWWGDSSITHCRDCHRTWPRQSIQAHCASCHLHFKSPYLFDLHLGPGDLHLSSPVHKTKRFFLDETGMWRQEPDPGMVARFQAQGAGEGAPPASEVQSEPVTDPWSWDS